ncbi:MAG: glycosyltransferase family 2 protein [Candidatus Hodarchaeota archaeon]
MRNNLVSVAMTTYNGEKYLREQLDSIYKQTYKNIEVIVSDDCSTDETVKILEEYQEKYGLQYSVNETNVGIKKNFERVISRCQGEYIALSDQDDVWVPEKIEMLVNNIGRHSLICSNIYRIDQNGKFLGSVEWIYFGIPSGKEAQFRHALYKNDVLNCALMFRREILSKVLPFPAAIDWWLALVAIKTNGIKYLNTPLIYHREHSDNYSFQGYHSYWRAILHFFTTKSYYRRHLYIRYLYENLRAAWTSSVFNTSERACMAEALDYYRDLLKSKLHLKAANIEIKHRAALYPYISVRHLLKRWLSILSKLLY